MAASAVGERLERVGLVVVGTDRGEPTAHAESGTIIRGKQPITSSDQNVCAMAVLAGGAVAALQALRCHPEGNELSLLRQEAEQRTAA